MPVIQLDLPPDLERFVRDQAKTSGHSELGVVVIDMLRQIQTWKTKADLEAKLLAGVEQLDRGEGLPMSAQDWKDVRSDYCRRHGIQNEA